MTYKSTKTWKTFLLSIFFPHPECSFVWCHNDVEQSSLFVYALDFGSKAKGVVGSVKSI